MDEIDENAQNMINGHHENEVAAGEGNQNNGDHLDVQQGDNHNGEQLMNQNGPVLVDLVNNLFDDIDDGMDGHLDPLVVEGWDFEQVYNEWLQQHNGNNGLLNGVGVNGNNGLLNGVGVNGGGDHLDGQGDNHHGMNQNEALLEIENFLLGDIDQGMDGHLADVAMEGWEFEQIFNEMLQQLNGNDHGNVVAMEEDDQGWDFNGNANVQVNGLINVQVNGGVNGIMNGVNGNAANAGVNEDGNAPLDFEVLNDEEI